MVVDKHSGRIVRDALQPFANAQPQSNWRIVEVPGLPNLPGFSLRLPFGWELHELQGIDSYLAQIHRRDDYAAAERAIGAREGDDPGTIWGRGGPVSVFSCRGETL